MTSDRHDERCNADRYLLGVIEQALQSGVPCRIHHPLQGGLIIYPYQHRFVATKEADLEGLCKTPVNRLQITSLNEVTYEIQFGRELEELLWIAAWHACGNMLPPGCSHYDVLELVHWPNLTRLPSTPDVLRLCALLSVKPHSLAQACRLLDMEEADALRFYSAGLYSGVLHRTSQTHSQYDEELETSQSKQAEVSSGRLGQTLRALWKRLKGGQ